MKTNLKEQVLKTIRSYEMLKPGDTVMVGLSGGPDSVYLLLALNSLKNKLKLKKLCVANLDHGLRPTGSREDSDFSVKLAKGLGLEFFHKRINLKDAKSKKLSTEEIAREARYKFFGEAAAKLGANVLATGHTLDDQAETIIMRIVKGASLKGLVGISPVREERGFRIIRPLIEIEKGDIMDHLDKENIRYRIDQTNLEDIYFRNVVRREVIPFLEKYNPRLKRSLFSLAEHLREDLDFIAKAKSKAGSLVRNTSGRSEISIKDIAVQPRTIQKEILRDMLESAGGEVKKLSFRHWKELEALVKHKRTGKSVDLPGSIRATRTASVISFSGI